MLSQNFCWDIDMLSTLLKQFIILDLHIYLKEKGLEYEHKVQ